MATEKRLIDANALCGKLADKALEAQFYDECEEQTLKECMSLVQNMPTVDAVEVVRCKDCSFIIDRADGTHGCYRHFVEDCKIDDFCSYGERKDNGKTD